MSNSISFVGICGADAEVKYLPSGSAVLNVRVANHVGFGDKQQTLWVQVSLFGKRAESGVVPCLKKGQHVFISGEMTVNEYQKNDGTNAYQLEVNANIIDLVGGKKDNQQATTQPRQPQTPNGSYQPDPDIPF